MPKPPFDPSKPFEVPGESVKSKPPFDPSKPFEAVDETEKTFQPPSALGLLGKGFVDVVGPAVEYIDRYTGAPVRKAVSELQNDKGIIEASKAGFRQIGKDSLGVPSGKEIVEKAGVPRTALSEVLPKIYSETGEGLPLKKGGFLDPTASGVAGLVGEVALDPTTYIPFGAVAKQGVKGVGKAIKKTTEGIKKGAALGEDVLRKGTARLGEAFTGVPKKEIETYIKKYDKVNKLIRETGGDVSLMSDNARQTIQADIQGTKLKMVNKINEALKNAPTEKTIPIEKIIKSIEDQKSSLNKIIDKEKIAEIDDLLLPLKEVAPEGTVSVQELFRIKEMMRDNAKGSYLKQGQIFTRSNQVSRAAKKAAKEADDLLTKSAPQIKEANGVLSKFHKIEETINKNLITPGKTEGALLATGSGFSRGKRSLQRLGELTGKDYVGTAEELAAAKRFADPGLLPSDVTGKAPGRTAISAGLGYLGGGAMGAQIGAALTSPIALKAAIQAGHISKDIIKKVLGPTAKLSDDNIKKLYSFLQTKEGQRLMDASIKTSKPLILEKQREEQKGLLK